MPLLKISYFLKFAFFTKMEDLWFRLKGMEWEQK